MIHAFLWPYKLFGASCGGNTIIAPATTQWPSLLDDSATLCGALIRGWGQHPTLAFTGILTRAGTFSGFALGFTFAGIDTLALYRGATFGIASHNRSHECAGKKGGGGSGKGQFANVIHTDLQLSVGLGITSADKYCVP
jgi:hypothetical protein